MVLTNKKQINGYVLEEVVSFLIRNSGYKVLTPSSSGDDPDLRVNGNDIRVLGRGSTHQVDVLGELDISLAFTFPLRIFVEAKCYENKKMGLNIIRNAVGTILDVNQNYFPRIEEKPRIKYHYSYVIFSTSGFSRWAINMAAAHQISIVDFSTQPYQDLVSAIDGFSAYVVNKSEIDNVHMLRLMIRGLLREKDNNYLPPLNKPEYSLSSEMGAISLEDKYRVEFNNILNIFDNNFGSLFLGVSYGPYLLVLKADNPSKFLEYMRQNPIHFVNIHFIKRERKYWYIEPAQNEGAYRLYFSLPEELGHWIFHSEEKRLQRANKIKSSIFSKLTILYRDEGVNGRLIVGELKYSAPSD